ncbi:MAG: NADPH-dependent FMN reductase [Acidimicrobiales bacterium]
MEMLLICGSVRAGSTSEAVLATVEQMAAGTDRATFYRGLPTLPHFNPDDDRDPLPSPVVALRAAIEAADALLFCTPEYAGDMPGSLKNLLDWTVGGVETEQKPAAWINASTASAGAAGTHAALRTVLSYTGCTIVETACVHLPIPRDAIDGGVVIDLSVRAGIGAVVDALDAHVGL